MTIRGARPEELDLVRQLFREYQQHIGVDLCFQSFEEELAGLPGKYAPPRGGLFLAWSGDATAGCVAFRPIDDETAEMKRLYVRADHHGKGLGRRLADKILNAAKKAGYRRVRLDTLPAMKDAIALYRKMGFEPIAPYTENPVEGALFFEKTL